MIEVHVLFVLDNKPMNIEQSLELFGLDELQQKVFLTLGRSNWSTVVQLSRICDIKRPNLYRILETFTDKGLIETRLDDKTTYYRAADSKMLEHLLLKMHSTPKASIYIFGSDDWRKIIDPQFAEELRAETVKQGSMIYELLNPEDTHPVSPEGEVEFTSNKTYLLKHFRHRQIPRKLLTLDKEIIVYDNTIHFYSYLGTDVTGI